MGKLGRSWGIKWEVCMLVPDITHGLAMCCLQSLPQKQTVLLTHLPVDPFVLRQVDLIKISSCHIWKVAVTGQGEIREKVYEREGTQTPTPSQTSRWSSVP